MSFEIYAHVICVLYQTVSNIDEKHSHINAPKVDVNTLFKNVSNEIILRAKDEFIQIVKNIKNFENK